MKADELGSLRPHLPSGYTNSDDRIDDEHGPAAAFEVNKFMKEIMKYTRSNVKNKVSPLFFHDCRTHLTDDKDPHSSYFWR